MILCIDPGPIKCGFIEIMATDGPYTSGHWPVSRLLHRMRGLRIERALIEDVSFYGMRVGPAVFATCVTIGRLLEVVLSRGVSVQLIRAFDARRAVCGIGAPGDGQLRAAIQERYPDAPWLAGVRTHAWDALTLWLAFREHGAKLGRVVTGGEYKEFDGFAPPKQKRTVKRRAAAATA